ncbi:MAG: hypothetical protein LUE88_05380 [Clostridiales bacterium]|nr:hypothetical protein [Clostridiales bacterium]
MKAKYIRITLIAAAVVLIAAGVLNGGSADVFNKGVRVCLECIGIG